jgi:hypothetical protein
MTQSEGGTRRMPDGSRIDDPQLAKHRIVLTVIVDAQGIDLGDATNNAVRIVDEALVDATGDNGDITKWVTPSIERSADVIAVKTLNQAMRSGLLAIRLAADPTPF